MGRGAGRVKPGAGIGWAGREAWEIVINLHLKLACGGGFSMVGALVGAVSELGSGQRAYFRALTSIDMISSFSSIIRSFLNLPGLRILLSEAGARDDVLCLAGHMIVSQSLSVVPLS